MSVVPDDEETLIARARAGDGDAFSVLVTELRPLLRNRARAFSRNEFDAEDLVAGAFLGLFEQWKRGVGPTTGLRTYLTQSMRNAAIDRSRSPLSRVQHVGELETYLLAVGHQVGVPDDALDLLDRQSDFAIVRRAFMTLPAAQQRILYETIVLEKKPRELTVDLDMSAGAIATAAHRARKALRAATLHEMPASDVFSHKAPRERTKRASAFVLLLPAAIAGVALINRPSRAEAVGAVPQLSTASATLLPAHIGIGAALTTVLVASIAATTLLGASPAHPGALPAEPSASGTQFPTVGPVPPSGVPRTPTASPVPPTSVVDLTVQVRRTPTATNLDTSLSFTTPGAKLDSVILELPSTVEITAVPDGWACSAAPGGGRCTTTRSTPSGGEFTISALDGTAPSGRFTLAVSARYGTLEYTNRASGNLGR